MATTPVRIGIVDTGFDLDHALIDPALIDRSGSFNHATGSSTDLRVGTQFHGQMVLGAMVWRAAGAPTALAPALPAAVQFELHSTSLSTTQIAGALNAARDTDVVNMSFGFTSPFADSLYNATYASQLFQPMLAGIQAGRGGLGVNYVASAGNARGSDESTFHHLQNSEFVTAVAAVDAQERVAWFSSPGENILVAAHGVDVITTAIRSVAGADLVRASGTSFSAPKTAVIEARIIEANPELGYRDVQTIMALSARDPLAAESGRTANAAQGWNGGGLTFSRDLGFGIADVEAAVALAETWQGSATWANRAVASETQGFNSLSGALGQGTTFVRTFTVDQAIDVEHVSLRVEIFHADFNDLVIEIVSPGGTVSRVMANSLQPGQVSGGLGFDFGIRRFMGEDAAGQWTVRITDTRDSAQAGWVQKLALTVTGRAGGEDDLHVYTDDFAANWTADRGLYDDRDGANTLNFAAVAVPVVLDMTGQGASSVAGRALTIAAGATAATVFLGTGDDRFTGTAAAETVHLRGGDDVAATGAGDDVIHHIAGNDRVDGGAGIDTLSFAVTVAQASWGLMTDGWARIITPTSTVVAWAVEVFRFLDASLGFDELFPAGGPILGTRHADTLDGSTGDEAVSGLGGHDRLRGSGGSDSLDGGTGFDTADYGGLAAPILLTGGVVEKADGQDRLVAVEAVIGTGFADDLATGAGVVRLLGGAGDDTLRGSAGNDQLYGEAGDDLFLGSGGNDRIDGGDGFDTLRYDGEAGGILYRYGRITGADGTVDRAFGIEALVGTGEADRIMAYRETLRVEGGAGDDTISGGKGADTLLGGEGNDTLHAYDPTSRATRQATDLATADRLEGGAGDDALHGSAGDNWLSGGAGSDTIDGGAGHDVAAFEGVRGDYAFRLIADFGLRVTDLTSGAVDRLYGIEDLAFVDGTVTMQSIVDPLAAIGITMVQSGTAGVDVLGGHAGLDLFVSTAGSDRYAGGEGFDTLSFAADPGGVVVTEGWARDGWGTIDRFTGVERVTGSAFADRLYGVQSAVVLDGADGDDLVRGGVADDVLYGGAGFDTVRGGAGRDLLSDSDALAKLVGDAGDDVIVFAPTHEGLVRGGAGHDTAVLQGAGTLRVASMGSGLLETFLGDGAGQGAVQELAFGWMTAGSLGVFGIDTLVFLQVRGVREADTGDASAQAAAVAMGTLGREIVEGRAGAADWAAAAPEPVSPEGWHHVWLDGHWGSTELWTDLDRIQIAGGAWVELV